MSKINGSITVEAAFVMPIFLFAILNLLSLVEILDVQMRLQAAMHQTAKEMAIYGYAYDKLGKEDAGSSILGNVAFSESYVRKKVNDYVSKPVLDKSCIDGGSGGITYSFSNIMDNDYIELVAFYRLAPRFEMIPFPKFISSTQAKVRAFTGYDNRIGNSLDDSGDNETYVFVTQSGTAYHRDRECTHLKLSIQLVEKNEVNQMRNDSGGKYKKCRSCSQNNGGSVVVIITNLGDRYHTSVTCSGLKRTVEEIPLSQANRYHPCSRCCNTD